MPVSELDSVVELDSAGSTFLRIKTSVVPVVTSVVGWISIVSVTTVSLIFCFNNVSQ